MNQVEVQATDFFTQTSDYGKVPNPAMPNTFMAVAIDTYDPKAPTGGVHTR